MSSEPQQIPCTLEDAKQILGSDVPVTIFGGAGMTANEAMMQSREKLTKDVLAVSMAQMALPFEMVALNQCQSLIHSFPHAARKMMGVGALETVKQVVDAYVTKTLSPGSLVVTIVSLPVALSWNDPQMAKTDFAKPDYFKTYCTIYPPAVLTHFGKEYPTTPYGANRRQYQRLFYLSDIQIMIGPEPPLREYYAFAMPDMNDVDQVKQYVTQMSPELAEALNAAQDPISAWSRCASLMKNPHVNKAVGKSAVLPLPFFVSQKHRIDESETRASRGGMLQLLQVASRRQGETSSLQAMR